MRQVSEFDRAQNAFWQNTTNLRPYNHPVVRAFAEQRVAIIAELLNGIQFDRMLDVGCGDGFGLYYMRRLTAHIYGCELSAAMLRQNPMNRILCQADAYQLPYANRSFDVVYCWEVLHHIYDPVLVVREMARVSRKYVLLCEPNSFNPLMALFGVLGPAEGGILRFTPWYLKRLARESGLCIRHMVSIGCFTPNRTPAWLAGFLRQLPQRWLLVGLSNIVLAELE